MIKRVALLTIFSTFNVTHSMQNLGTFRKDLQPPADFLETLEQSKALVPKNMITRGYHNERALDQEGKVCIVPDPEPKLYADELLHLQDEKPMETALATIIIKECFQLAACYKHTLDNDPFNLHETHKTFIYRNDPQESLLFAKAAATKLGRSYKIIPTSTLHRLDTEKLLREIFTKKQPCTVILHELNNEDLKPFINACTESDKKTYPIHLLITSRQQLRHTQTERTNKPNCTGRLRLIRYYLDKLPVKTDASCSEAYLTSVAERTSGFSVDTVERLVNAVLLYSLGKPGQSAENASINQEAFETVLKEDFGITWLQGLQATLASRYWDTK